MTETEDDSRVAAKNAKKSIEYFRVTPPESSVPGVRSGLWDLCEMCCHDEIRPCPLTPTCAAQCRKGPSALGMRYLLFRKAGLRLRNNSVSD
jgi:hypothetical protein